MQPKACHLLVFKNLLMDDKLQFVKSKKLGFNCLKSGHSSKNCKSKSTCRTWKKRHNTLLDRPTAPSNPELNIQSHLSHKGASSCDVILLPTAVINIKTASNKILPFRALLDSTSQVTGITYKCSERLGLRVQNPAIKFQVLVVTFHQNLAPLFRQINFDSFLVNFGHSSCMG